MGPFIAKLFKKFESERLLSDILDCFTINFQPIAMICTFFGKGGVLPTYNQSFIKIGPKLRDLWDHLLPKLFKKIRVRELWSDMFGIVLLSISNRLP